MSPFFSAFFHPADPMRIAVSKRILSLSFNLLGFSRIYRNCRPVLLPVVYILLHIPVITFGGSQQYVGRLPGSPHSSRTKLLMADASVFDALEINIVIAKIGK